QQRRLEFSGVIVNSIVNNIVNSAVKLRGPPRTRPQFPNDLPAQREWRPDGQTVMPSVFPSVFPGDLGAFDCDDRARDVANRQRGARMRRSGPQLAPKRILYRVR